MLTEILGLVAYNVTAAVFGFAGAYAGVFGSRKSEISWREALAIFLVTWLIGTVISFAFLLLFATFGMPIEGPYQLLVAIVIYVVLGRKLIEYRERKKIVSPAHVQIATDVRSADNS